MPKPNPRLAYLSIKQLAERLEVSTRTVSRWIADGELRAHKIGRMVRIAEDDAIAFLAARRC